MSKENKDRGESNKSPFLVELTKVAIGAAVGAVITVIVTNIAQDIAGNNYESLYHSLKEEHSVLESDYGTLKNDRNKLQSDYNELEEKYIIFIDQISQGPPGQGVGSESGIGEPLPSPTKGGTDKQQDANYIEALTLEPFNSSGVKLDKPSVKDRLGNTFNRAIILDQKKFKNNLEERSYNLEYYLNSEYSKLTATLASYEGGDSGSVYLFIYADDILLYSSPLVTEKTNPIYIELDISDSRFIQFIACDENNYSSDVVHQGKLLINDVKFYN